MFFGTLFSNAFSQEIDSRFSVRNHSRNLGVSRPVPRRLYCPRNMNPARVVVKACIVNGLNQRADAFIDFREVQIKDPVGGCGSVPAQHRRHMPKWFLSPANRHDLRKVARPVLVTDESEAS